MFGKFCGAKFICFVCVTVCACGCGFRCLIYRKMKERKRKFLQKFRMSSNELCVIFRDKATADLELQ